MRDGTEVNMRLANKTAVITGAANGIGRAIALKFAEQGARIVSSDLSFMAAESISDKIKDLGGEAIPIKADVTNAQDMETLFKEAQSAFNRIDILVSNAGIRKDALLHQMTEAQWNDVVDVQLKGCFNSVRFAQSHLIQQQHGKIIIVASPVPPDLGRPGNLNYTAANAGLIGMTTSLAIELGGYNINVNCIAPDFIETSMTRENIKKDGMFLDDFKKVALARIPLKRLGTVEDVANVALFLASDESAYVSGQVIKVTGGP
jgi:3-oxoacyl-[acyl-carrier protein] reductase